MASPKRLERGDVWSTPLHATTSNSQRLVLVLSILSIGDNNVDLTGIRGKSTIPKWLYTSFCREDTREISNNSLKGGFVSARQSAREHLNIDIGYQKPGTREDKSYRIGTKNSIAVDDGGGEAFRGFK